MIRRTFLAGLLAILPLALTLYLVVWLLGGAEALFRQMLFIGGIGEYYRPGYGFAAATLLTFIAGILVQSWGFGHLYRAGQNLLERIPGVKTVYGAVSSVLEMVAPSTDAEQRLRGTVLVSMPGDLQLIGFITQSSPADMIDGIPSDRVAVYLPMSYQVGGYTLLVSPDQLTPLDVPADVAMRLALTGFAGR